MARPSDPNAKIKLLRAAETVFVEHGLDRARVEDITTEAGLSKGAFYLHFKSKEEVFLQLVETMLARLSGSIESGAGETHANAREHLEAQLERDIEIFEFIWQNRALTKLLLQGGRSASHAHLMDEFAERARLAAELRLRHGMANDLFREDVDVPIAAIFIAGAYDRLARQVVKEGRKPDVALLMRSVQNLVIRAIGTPLAITISDSLVTKENAPKVALVKDRSAN